MYEGSIRDDGTAMLTQTIRENWTQTYEGGLLNGYFHGVGVLRGRDGELIYNGEWRTDTMHGRGIFVYYGDIYEGDMVENKKHGKGKLENDMMVYDGDWLDNQKHGKGRHLHKSLQHVYDGDWVADKRHGYGSFDMPPFQIYQGGFHDNKMHGSGVMKNKFSNATHEGEWVESMMHGKFIKTWEDGTTNDELYDNGRLV